MLSEAADEHCANLQLAPDSLCFGLLSLVAQDRVKRLHFQAWQLRKIVDDAVADSFRKIIFIRIVVDVYKRQDRNRIYRIAAGAVGEVGEIRDSRGNQDHRRQSK